MNCGSTVLILLAGSSALRSLSLCGITGRLVEAIQRFLAASRCSTQAQLLSARDWAPAQPDLLVRAADWRQRLGGRDFSSLEAVLRADRSR